MSSHVPVTDYRSRADFIPGGIELIIPSQRNYFTAAFIAVWLCGWVFGESFAVEQLISPEPTKHGGGPDLFLVVWLCGWTVVGFFALSTLLWTLAGRERVIVRSDTFSICREAVGIGWSKHYDIRVIKALRAVESGNSDGFFGSGKRDPYGLRSGPLAFDYGAKTIRFGAGIDMAEAKYLLAKILAAKPGLAKS